MKIQGKILIKVEETDIINGVFRNDKVTEIADSCLSKLKSLKKVILPNVKKVGSYCLIGNNKLTSVDLPQATTFGDFCLSCNNKLTSVDLPQATTFGDFCLRYNDKLTSVDLPQATTFGSSCLHYNDKLTSVDLPQATTFGDGCLSCNNKLTSVVLKKHKFSTDEIKYVDGYLYVIESQEIVKGIKVYSGYNFVSMKETKIKKESCYVAEKDGYTAHGESIKEAISDVRFKIVAEKLQNEPINKDTIITPQYYHTVTGACRSGIKSWMKHHKIKKDEIKASELLPILEKTNAYGVDKFKSLISWK